MSGWKVVYRDILDHDRIFPSVSSKEAALAHARNLHRESRVEIYKIEVPAGGIVPKDEVMRWVSAQGGADKTDGRARGRHASKAEPLPRAGPHLRFRRPLPPDASGLVA